MNEHEGQAGASRGEQEPLESPAEKLEGEKPVGSPVPGAENPESDEVKGETNPNTE